MPGSSWQFRTTRGVVTVEDDAIVLTSPPTAFLSGQRGRWRHGGPRDRAGVALRVLGFGLSVVAIAYHVALLAESEPNWSAALTVLVGGFLALSFWGRYLRPTTIPRSAIDRVAVDDERREITISHDTGEGLGAVLQGDRTETSLRFATPDDLRRAREVCRLRGIDLAPPREAVETTYRVVTEDGVVFCERCRSQVSPSDRRCPACDYALRVRVTETS